MRNVFGFIAAAILSLACATPHRRLPPITSDERIKRDQALGSEIARPFDTQLKFKKDKEVLAYLKNLASTLAGFYPELGGSPIEVLLVQDPSVLRNFALPGLRIYLSSNLIKRLDFENQIAATIALEIAHISKRHVLLRVQEEVLRARRQTEHNLELTTGASVLGNGVAGQHSIEYGSLAGLFLTSAARQERPFDYFGPHGVFDFPDEFHVSAAEGAVELLYSASFEPRGLVSLWSMYGAHPDSSPFGPDLLAKLMEKTRRTIALHAPLRNPIVRSQSFLTIQKRIRQL